MTRFQGERCEGRTFTGGFTDRCFNRSTGTFTFTKDTSFSNRTDERSNKGDQQPYCTRCGNKGERFNEGTFERNKTK